MDEVQRAVRVLNAHVPKLRVVHASSVGAARKAVDDVEADLIITRHDLSDGTCADVLNVAGDGLDGIPVYAYVMGAEDEAIRVRKAHPQLLDCQVCSEDGSHLLRTPARFLLSIARIRRRMPEGAGASTGMLRKVRHTISRVNHDLNNPLSIISGNAQLLAELSRVMDLDKDLCSAIQDIEEASSRVQGILRRLLDLRDQLPMDDAGRDLREELQSLQDQHPVDREVG